MTLRVTGDAENPWFVAKDVCDALGIETKNARRSLDEDEIKSLNLSGFRGRPPLAVSESGLYALTLKSRKPEAKSFRKWVTSAVLPAIRKDGGYIRGEENAQSEEELILAAMQVLQRKVTKLAAQAHGLDPDAEQPSPAPVPNP
ncbi:phage antirepressor protein [Cupriavidus sp. SK-4]|uniref:BRO-N domain-containing protein n=1 Tax=Cupriavidus sp. SK-4 TaxID=574750 RepID=UPI0004522E29|nr:BRO family protein [Cupriavidus sp. SK-4]EYS96296.1 phage antirepressor protein [Cupriavidus sp. SK-4]